MMDSLVLKKGGLQNYLETTLVPWDLRMYICCMHAWASVRVSLQPPGLSVPR